MLNNMSKNENNIKVHLVHGTWANGWLKSKNSWFNQDSDTYRRLMDQLPSGTQVQAFLWSGKNSIDARDKAAGSLCRYLEDAISQSPHTSHVIVAHSHGGTVAADALGRLFQCSPQQSQVKALICLATPFTYLARPSFAQFQTGLVAAASLAYVLYWICILAFFPWIPEFVGQTGFITLVTVKALLAFLLVVWLARGSFDSLIECSSVLHPRLPIYLLRATRDEASLSIGLMQVFSWLGAAFAQSHDITQSTIRRPLTYLGYAIAYCTCFVIGANGAKFIASQFGLHWTDWVFAVLTIGVFSPAVAGTVYLLAYASLALVVGHTSLNRWLTTRIEVDAAPPGMMCKLKVYSALSGSTGGLRHGLYEDDEVLKDVGVIVREVMIPA
jgi:pimeloyl-ACP methyl ester carboxylesterase